jgi:aspartate/methionine/tyrosine aminotransferase
MFEDDDVRPELLRRHSHTRWASLPAGTIPLTAAEPDFPVAREITAAVTEAAASGHFQYSPPQGLARMKEAVAHALRDRHQLPYGPEHLLPTLGTAAALWTGVHRVCRPGDEVILLDPVDLLFGLAVDSVGARRVYCRVDTRTGRVDLEQLRAAITPRTRLICLCNPHNPVGSVMSVQELRAIGELAVEHGLRVLADEVWSEIVYPPHQHVSLASLGPEIARQTLTVVGPSKTFGLSGLRIGFIAAPSAEEVDSLLEVSMRLGSAFGLTGLAQVAAEVAYRECWPWRDAFVAHLRQMRDLCVERLNRIPGVSCRLPEATYVAFPDISSLGMSSPQVAELLLQEARVAVVPGTVEWFGPGAEGHVRLCFATSRALLEEGLERIARVLSATSR